MADGSTSGRLPPDLLAEDAAALGQTLGNNLRRLRRRRGLSLERLARLSGVSRAMLGQIETGKSVPTIAVLWRVTTTLEVPFATLLAQDQACGTVVMRRARARFLSNADGRFASRALFRADAGRRVEFYELRLAAGHEEIAEPHAPGTRENLIVVAGTVEITVGTDSPQVLEEGDAIQFEADFPHGYRNPGADTAVLHLVLSYVEPIG